MTCQPARIFAIRAGTQIGRYRYRETEASPDLVIDRIGYTE